MIPKPVQAIRLVAFIELVQNRNDYSFLLLLHLRVSLRPMKSTAFDMYCSLR